MVASVHHRKTLHHHLQFEALVTEAGDFEPQGKPAIYRLAEGLVASRQISKSDHLVLRAIIGAAGDGMICSCSNFTLAGRAHLASETQVSRAVARLRDAGLITAIDSANCKRRGGFGLSIKILHVRFDELMQEIQWHSDERKNLAINRSHYQSCKRRIGSIIAYNDLSEAVAHMLYEKRGEAQALIDEARRTAKHVTSEIYAKAKVVMERAIGKVLDSLDTMNNSQELSCEHDKNAMQIPITTLNPSRISNDRRKSANADHIISQNAATGGEEAFEKKPDAKIEDGQAKSPVRSKTSVTLEMVMQACPSLKLWLLEPVQAWPDLVRQTDQLARVLGVHPSAVHEGRSVMGDERFAVAMAITAQKAEHPDEDKRVNQPGGYVRGMIAKATDGELHLDRSIFGLLAESGPVAAH